MKEKNKALITKWIWIHYHGDNALWRKLIKAKYTPTSCTNQPPPSSAKEPWKYIKKHQNLITNRICHRVSDGGSTSLWIDYLIENTMLALQYPLMYRSYHSRTTTIKERWNDVNKFADLKLGRNLKDNKATKMGRIKRRLCPNCIVKRSWLIEMASQC